MNKHLEIKSIVARQVFLRQEFSGLGHPAVEAVVRTEGNAIGVGVATGGFSLADHESRFLYDGGSKWNGQGVSKAVDNVNSIIGPRLKGIDVSKQEQIDDILIKLDGTRNKSRLGGNAVASVSAAVLKAGAHALGMPLYQHIGGGGAVAYTLPVPGVICIDGSNRYRTGMKSGGKPSYAFICYGFKSFAESSYACWQCLEQLKKILSKLFGQSLQISNCFRLPPGLISHDRELWKAMSETIEELGYSGRVGIQVDVAADTYYDRNKQKFIGLFSKKPQSRDQLFNLYKEMTETYQFVIIEDPLCAEDFEGHARLTKELGIDIVGDDLFATNPERLKKGIRMGACNSILLKMPQIGTVTEAIEVVKLAQNGGFSVMPCGSRGEGPDIADYAVGLDTGYVREGGLGPTGNRLLEIETELGENARFLGKKALHAYR